MKFKLDENLPFELCNDLRTAGREADTVVAEGLAGAADSEILERARAEQRVLLTLDKGIADIRAYPPARYAGVVLVRCPSSGRSAVRVFVRGRLSRLLQVDLVGRLAVMTDRSIRLR